jgi:hypothetical protein
MSTYTIKAFHEKACPSQAKISLLEFVSEGIDHTRVFLLSDYTGRAHDVREQQRSIAVFRDFSLRKRIGAEEPG